MVEFLPKRHYNYRLEKEEHRMNLFRRRTIPPGSLIHEAAFARGEEYVARLPADATRVT